MERVIPDLYASAPQPLPFAPSIVMRAFLCQREEGNLLVYTTMKLETEAHAIAELGGVSRQYLNHWHEAEFVPKSIAPNLIVHERERASVAEKAQVGETFADRHMLDDDFEVIPTPGHTPGTTAYRWSHGEHRVLFTGDTIYLRDGDWVAALLESSDRDEYVASLELIRELDFDVLVPWIATGGQPYYAVTEPSDARRRIDMILTRLEARPGR